VRGRKPVNLSALEQLVVRFSHLAAEQRWIQEIEVNPLLVSAERMLALDARVVLYPAGTREEDLPKTAIRPYPVQYVKPWQEFLIRPVRPEDEPRMVRFHGTLSDRSVYLRYFHLMNFDQRVAHERLARICFVDYDREMVLVAEQEDEILAVGRLTRARQGNEAELAVLISDAMQGHGLGTELFRRLIEIARAEGLERVTAEILPENDHMVKICRMLGFGLRYSIDEHVVKADLPLN
jgi:acetyltransferase